MSEIITVIDIGSSAIRMCIAEHIGKKINLLENLSHPVPLGKDTFRSGRLARETINSCIEILLDYRKVMQMFRSRNITACATTAIREAANRDIFIDNVRSQTGIEVEVYSPAQTSFLLSEQLKKKIKTNQCSAGFSLGAGRSELMVFSKDGLIYNASLDIGFMKMNQEFRRNRYTDEYYPAFLETTVGNELRPLLPEFAKYAIQSLYGTGQELSEILFVLNRRFGGEPRKSLVLKELLKLYGEIKGYSTEELFHKLMISYDKAEGIIAALVTVIQLMRMFKASELKLFSLPLGECLLGNLVARKSEHYTAQLATGISSYVENIGNALSFDAVHAQHVASLALEIFDATRQIHLMGQSERNYLLAAAMLHDIGNVIATRARHKHSQYIVNAQDFPFFNDEEKGIIANVVRYHRSSLPKKTHPEFMALSHPARMTVMKLASLLRIADSLENSQRQNIRKIRFDCDEGGMIIIIDCLEEPFSIENSFNSRKDLFEDFFGIKLKLVVERTRT
ncbi:MAG: hypothetical protein CVV42_18720 [Candidatus Riflebacteria bacterium HGW-Riflebacteria-2]|nr:MAG: hypothetical protein CVV42_18720 [Candidatus Riflebacteria bacterium HGW-Riflebacteria-2]